MVRSLWTASTGMMGQQFQIDTISNNLANINTIGFKKNRVDFQDLLYQHPILAGTPATAVSEIPTGVNVGHGVRVAGTQKLFDMGSLQSTGHKLDMSISNQVGFFKVQLPDGTFAFQRDGAFKIDSNRQVVTSNGYLLEPNVILPQDGQFDTLTITEQGEMTINIGDDESVTLIGQLELYKFRNPAGLKAIGSNLYKTSGASGEEIPGIPGINGFGAILQGFLEQSNVNLAEEMVNMIVAQRAYESNSKSITTSDSMLSTAIQMKRS